MEAQATRNNTHPILIIAAISVTLLSAAGIAAIMGWIPASNSQQAATPAVAEVPKSLETKPTEVHKVAEAAKPAPVPAAKSKSAAKPVAVAETKPAAAPESRVVEYTPPPVQVAAAPPARPICHDCGLSLIHI